MNWLRYHWFDLSFVLAIVLGIFVVRADIHGMTLLMWLSLGSLFLHQVEEWRWPGYFPGMLNARVFKSDQPDRYPLNAQSGFVVNVIIGWGSYLLAALFWDQAFWLAIGTILVSLGNVLAHTIVFNVKGKTLYNPGLFTCWAFFVPVIVFFFLMTTEQGLASPVDWVIGIVLGGVLNYFGVFKMIDYMADRDTPYVFPQRSLCPSDRHTPSP
mgnify:CR=1 FL=1